MAHKLFNGPMNSSMAQQLFNLQKCNISNFSKHIKKGLSLLPSPPPQPVRGKGIHDLVGGGGSHLLPPPPHPSLWQGWGAVLINYRRLTRCSAQTVHLTYRLKGARSSLDRALHINLDLVVWEIKTATLSTKYTIWPIFISHFTMTADRTT